jgi:hypothetical protein
MNPPEPEVGKVAPQPAPPRKSRAGLVALVLILLVVVAGGATAYYYAFYLPATPREVLKQFLAFQQKNDYEGTYRFLSTKTRTFFPAETWKSMNEMQAPMRAQMSVDYTVGQPNLAGAECRIPVTAQRSYKSVPKGVPPSLARPRTTTDTILLVKEKAGWKVALIEGQIEQYLDAMRKRGARKGELDQARQALEKMFSQPYQQGVPR